MGHCPETPAISGWLLWGGTCPPLVSTLTQVPCFSGSCLGACELGKFPAVNRVWLSNANFSSFPGWETEGWPAEGPGGLAVLAGTVVFSCFSFLLSSAVLDLPTGPLPHGYKKAAIASGITTTF